MLSLKSFKSIFQITKTFTSNSVCKEFITSRRWGSDVVCPYCGKHHCKKYGERFHCSGCGRKFSCLVGTIFENTKLPLQKWFIAIYLITSHKKGISSCQLARDIDVSQKTAWFLLMKIRMVLNQVYKPSDGLFEVDEVYLGGKEKFMHKKRIGKHKTGLLNKKIPVFGIIKPETGNVNAWVIPVADKAHIYPHIYSLCNTGSTIVTDESKLYVNLSPDFDHKFVRHRLYNYVTHDGYTTNSIEGFWTHLRRMLVGVYHKTSEGHLQRYVDEEVFRWNGRSPRSGGKRSLSVLSNISIVKLFERMLKCRLTYAKVIC